MTGEEPLSIEKDPIFFFFLYVITVQKPTINIRNTHEMTTEANTADIAIIISSVVGGSLGLNEGEVILDVLDILVTSDDDDGDGVGDDEIDGDDGNCGDGMDTLIVNGDPPSYVTTPLTIIL
jgi:hypothetical protein